MNDKITVTNKNITIQELQLPSIKSKMTIGSLIIFNTKKFNWLQRKMFKIFFGIEINNLESKGDK